jgi:hypothetical protein
VTLRPESGKRGECRDRVSAVGLGWTGPRVRAAPVAACVSVSGKGRTDGRNAAGKELPGAAGTCRSQKPRYDPFHELPRWSSGLACLALVAAISCSSFQADDASDPLVRKYVADLTSPDPRTREASAGALGVHGSASEQVLLSLLAACKDRSADVRRSAIYSLVWLAPSDPRTRKILVDAVEDGDRMVRLLALGELEKDPENGILALSSAQGAGIPMRLVGHDGHVLGPEAARGQ